MDKILAQRFSPFNFSVVPGFPNVVPTPDEWVDYFPIFKERKEDNPAQHLVSFMNSCISGRYIMRMYC
jgi:hypothetical protein